MRVPRPIIQTDLCKLAERERDGGHDGTYEGGYMRESLIWIH